MSGEKDKSILTQLKAMKQKMDTLFSDSFQGSETESIIDEEAAWKPFVDVFENEDQWCIVADLPGVADTELQVEVVNDQLVITGRRSTISLSPEARITRAERPSGAFSRSFVLPQRARPEAIDAELKLGVLTIRVPKDHSARQAQHRIVVQSG